jgi:demethylmenaquinone methyltransferase/2-methoxy-6-polyprenyl-1,4-benzoquinol methylase
MYDRQRAREYDHDLVIRWAAGVRRRAIQALSLHSGETVLDVACGTGLNLAALRGGVGADGSVIGIDISAAMLEIARGRIDAGGWTNVELINTAIQEAALPADGDAALFSFAHDVLHSPEAIEKALSYLRPGARVVACGAMQKWFPGPLGWWLPKLISRMYTGGRAPMERPWEGLAAQLDAGQTRRIAAYLGTMYVFVGRTKDHASTVGGGPQT